MIRRVFLIGIAPAAVLLALGWWHAPAQPPAAGGGRPSASVSECKICHSGPHEGLRDYTKKCMSLEFIRLDESLIWERHDPHSLAFAVLKTPLGQSMSERLGYDVTKAPQCLTCHAIDQNPANGLKEKTAAQFAAGDSLGIGCTGCHGLDRAWQTEHYRMEDKGNVSTVPWRTLSPGDKQKAGLRNLRHPVVKAELCASCHIGNSAEGKVITHAMYAAGHPPLPPFELVTYTRDQPKHWKEPGELKYFASLPADQLRSLFSARPASEELATVKQLAIGVIVALKAEVNLLAANAATLPPHGDLDYARFDCYACHHDLKTPSDRQKRGYDGPPGRPPLKAWIGSMAQIITDHAKQTKPSDVARLAAEFPAKWQAVRDAAYAKPYGDPVRMTQATKPLVAWADDFVMALDESAVYSTEESAKLKSMLAGRISNEKTLADPEAAIALGWAYQSVSMAIDGKPAPTRTALYYYHGLRPTATGTKPVAVGTIAGERLKQFNDFNAGEFLKAIGVK